MNEPFLSSGVAWTVLAIFAVGWISLGIFWGRNAKTTNQYLFAGRSVGLALATTTLMATWVTGNTVLSAPEQAYLLGIWGIIGYSFAGFGLLAFAPLSIRIKKLMPNGFTSGDFIHQRYGRWVWGVFMFISVFYFLGLMVTQGMAAGLVLQALTGFPYQVGLVVVVVVTTAYTFFGGMRAVIGMDFIQALLILVCLTTVAVWAYVTFGVGDVYRGLQENQPSALNLLLPAGLLYAWNTGLFAMGEIFHSNLWWQRAYSSPPRVNFRSFLLSGILWMSVPIVTGSIALVALALPGRFDIPQVNMTFPIVAAELLGPVGGVLILIIVFAALASTMSALFTTSSTLITEDFYRRFINPEATDQQVRNISRALIVALALLTIAMSWVYVTSVYGVLLLTGALVGACVWPIACGLYWEKSNRSAAFWALVLGSISGLVFYFAVSSFAAALLGFVVSAVIMVVGTLLKPQSFDWNTLSTTGTRKESEREPHDRVGG